MLLLLHVSIALSSLFISTLLWLKPSTAKFNISSVFITLTLASGTFLVVSSGSSLLRACAAGLAYTAVSLYFLLSARSRLGEVSIISNK